MLRLRFFAGCFGRVPERVRWGFDSAIARGIDLGKKEGDARRDCSCQKIIFCAGYSFLLMTFDLNGGHIGKRSSFPGLLSSLRHIIPAQIHVEHFTAPNLASAFCFFSPAGALMLLVLPITVSRSRGLVPPTARVLSGFRCVVGQAPSCRCIR